jgi:UDP-glucose 4-epimerase
VETTIRELAERVNALAGNSTPIALTPARDWDRSGQRFGDPAKATEKLGFTAVVAHNDGLEKTIAWARENRGRILGCMMQHARYVPQVKAYER